VSQVRILPGPPDVWGGIAITDEIEFERLIR
jgi:hypothetical protein